MTRTQDARKQPVIVIAGAVPPPVGGQALMIQDFVRQLRKSKKFRTIHWEWRFVWSSQQFRRFRWGKIRAALAALAGLFKIRHAEGKIDLLLYPIGGPQTVPILRDILILPFVFWVCPKVILHFHAGGADEGLRNQIPPIRWLAKKIYRRVFGAISLSEFGLREPRFLGVKRALVVPLDFPDTYDASLIRRHKGKKAKILSLGHICEEKGTLVLLRALRFCRDQGADFQLTLAGECLYPCSQEVLLGWIHGLGLEKFVKWTGCMEGHAKADCFGRAELFVFPSLALESFGIVMVEAMMWGLPVLALNRRANYEILSKPRNELRVDNEKALPFRLASVLKSRSHWKAWGCENRKKFLSLYRRKAGESHLALALHQMALARPGN